jgi:hypothetical protein
MSFFYKTLASSVMRNLRCTPNAVTMSTSGATRSGSHVSGASSGSSKSKHGIRAAQTSADARLNAAFEASNGSGSFDYTQTVDASKTTSESLPISQASSRILFFYPEELRMS